MAEHLALAALLLGAAQRHAGLLKWCSVSFAWGFVLKALIEAIDAASMALLLL